MELVVKLEEVVVDNCLMEMVEEMEVTTDIVETVTEWDSETMDFEVVTLKFFFFRLVEDWSVVVLIFSVVVLRSVLNLTAPSQEMTLLPL